MNHPAPQTILAIDLGTQSLRLSALRTDGARLWSWSAPVDSQWSEDSVEQSPAQWRTRSRGWLSPPGRPQPMLGCVMRCAWYAHASC